MLHGVGTQFRCESEGHRAELNMSNTVIYVIIKLLTRFSTGFDSPDSIVDFGPGRYTGSLSYHCLVLLELSDQSLLLLLCQPVVFVGVVLHKVLKNLASVCRCSLSYDRVRIKNKFEQIYLVTICIHIFFVF